MLKHQLITVQLSAKSFVLKAFSFGNMGPSSLNFEANIPSLLCILGCMVRYQCVIGDLSQSAPAVGWGNPLRARLASVNWIGGARCLNKRYCYGAHGMHYHILLQQHSQNCYTYNSVANNTYSPCHKDACVQISIGNTEWLLLYKGVS